MFLNKENIDILCVCEVLPKNRDHNISSFVIDGYICYQCLEGRGVCIFVKTDLGITIVELEGIQSIFKPSVFLKVISPKSTFTLGIVYRSPNCSEEDSSLLITQMNDAIKDFKNQNEHLILLGDFNFPEINWEDEICSLAPCHKSAALFLEHFHFNNLHQLIAEPTHHRCMQTPTLIDLLITDDPMFINNVCFHPPFGMSHHSVIHFYVNANAKTPPKDGVFKLQVNKGQYNDFRSFLHSIDWNANSEDVDVLWDRFHSSMKAGEERFVPKKLIKPGSPKKHSCPWSPGLLHRVHMKRVAFKNYKRHPTTSNYKLCIVNIGIK